MAIEAKSIAQSAAAADVEDEELKPEHVLRLLKKLWAERGIEVEQDGRLGIGIQDIVDTSAQRNGTKEVPYFAAWIVIFDELASWLVSLSLTLYGGRATTKKPFSNFERSIFMLLGKVISDAVAIRHLILCGYDVQARIILRSTGEYIECLLAILDNPALSDEFVITELPEHADRFWRNHLAKGKVRKKVKQAWRTLFTRTRDREAAEWFSNWSYSEYSKLSAMTHPTFAGGMLCMIPAKSRYGDSDSWLGMFGERSEGSIGTIYIFATQIFPVLLLFNEFPFCRHDRFRSEPLAFDDSNEFHRHVKHGRSVLGSLVLSLGDDRLFPEIADLPLSPTEEEETVGS